MAEVLQKKSVPLTSQQSKMKEVLISIKPKWCEKIALGKKTIELRRNFPKLPTPFKCYIYCTKEKILGELVLIKSDELKTLFPDQKVVGVNKSAYHNEDIPLRGMVIGEFICDKISAYPYDNGCYGIFYPTEEKDSPEYRISAQDIQSTCVPYSDIEDYGNGDPLYGWHISNLVIYDTPKELTSMQKVCSCKGEYEGEEYCDCLNCENAGDSDYGIIACNRSITRAPQSWCYTDNIT